MCESGSCRVAVTCQDLRDAGTCDPEQVCKEAQNGADAECVSGECNTGFAWDSTLEACVEAALPSCDPDAPQSIYDECRLQLRECMEDATNGAQCGACISGTKEVDGDCVSVILCGGAECQDDEYCDGDTCQALPCAAGEAEDSGGTCQSCGVTCDGDGVTGRVWPFMTATDQCVCETRPGYYFPPGGTTSAVSCDADGDGWVRREADAVAVTGDPALAANARCTIRRVEGVRLIDEYGTELEIGSCTEGLVENPDTGSCTGRVAMRLLESEKTDVPGRASGVEFPEYTNLGGSGRALRADELNGLTKACVSLAGDFNDNGQEDIAEVQVPPDQISGDDQKRLESFAYFLELYSARYVEPVASGSDGTLVIQERSRCDADTFPFHYDPAVDPTESPVSDAFSSDGSTYWRSCYRGRDPDFDSAAGKAGFDFGQWSCSDTLGSCPVPRPAHPDIDATSLDPNQTLLRDHGLCNLGSATAPADGVWRGMHHHSQFKCVNVTATPSAAYDREPSLFNTSGSLVFNDCAAQSCDPADDACTDSRRTTSGAGTFEPVIACEAQDVLSTAVSVGWAAVRYQPYGTGESGDPATYPGGCVNEDAVWGDLLCPQPEFTREVQRDAFGRYSCYGQGSNFLWAPASGAATISTLVWAPASGAASNGSVLR